MDVKFCACCLCSLLYVYVSVVRGGPQSIEDPTKFYKKFKMDQIHRGSVNISFCINEMLNCWEHTRVEYMCSNRFIFESLCGVMFKECDYDHGWYEGEVNMFETFCRL